MLDPDFATNHYYYVFYTLGSPNHDRVSRFTANASLDGHRRRQRVRPLRGSAERERRAPRRRAELRQRRQAALHHRRALQSARVAPLLTSPRGKVHRINPDGTVPTDNPFYDGAGPNVDSIWARGLRNPYRAYYDAPTGRYFIGDVGGNDASTSIEEVDLGVRGANYGWPRQRGPVLGPCRARCSGTRTTAATPRSPAASSTTAPSSRAATAARTSTPTTPRTGSGACTLDANGAVTGTFNFEPSDGSVDGPYGDIVYLAEGPDGALYYLDLGYSDDQRHVRREQDPPDQVRAVEPGAGRVRVGDPDLRPGTAGRHVLERRLVRPRGPAADLLVELRRRRHLDRGQPVAHLRTRPRAPIRRA